MLVAPSSVIMTTGLLDLTHSASSLGTPRSMRLPSRSRAKATRPLILENPVSGVRLVEVSGALSYALDLAEGQGSGHAIRTALIGMRIGARLGLPESDQSALLYALLLKDLGSTSNSARLSEMFGTDDLTLKRAYKLIDWTSGSDSARFALKHALPGQPRRVRMLHAVSLGMKQRGAAREMFATRAERGAEIAGMLSLPRQTAAAIAGLDEHWDGGGMPLGLQGSAIPMLSRIVGLAQTVEVFSRTFDVSTAYEMAMARKGSWFDPVLVDCLQSFRLDATFWQMLRDGDIMAELSALEPSEDRLMADNHRLDTVAEGFAKVIDAKSRFTVRHSQNVAFLADRTAKELGVSKTDRRTLRRAALLHNIGQLGVSNTILDKPSALDRVELELMRQHPRYTFEILKRVPRFRQFAATAAAHHEKLDGSGYHLGLRGEEIGTLARILAVADICDALSSDRPYRKAMPLETVTARLDELAAAGHLCPAATDALCGWFDGVPKPVEQPGSTTSAAA